MTQSITSRKRKQQQKSCLTPVLISKQSYTPDPSVAVHALPLYILHHLFRNAVTPDDPPEGGPIQAIERFFEIVKTHIEVGVPFNKLLDDIAQYKYLFYCSASLPETFYPEVLQLLP